LQYVVRASDRHFFWLAWLGFMRYTPDCAEIYREK
jgi:hypothetical protein